jgi:hemolysin III
VPPSASALASGGHVRPRLRGVLHQYAFFVSLSLGALLVAAHDPVRQRVAAAVFAASVAVMFGVSALYNRVTWSPSWRRWMRSLDHTTIFLFIAGSYTPVGLVVLSGAWRVVILAVVWGGVSAAVVVSLVFPQAPKWVAATIGVALGWVGVAAFPKLLDRTGPWGVTLALLAGLLYTLGALVYARRRPDPHPAVFGYHELFHALVIAAVACEYVCVAFFMLDLA